VSGRNADWKLSASSTAYARGQREGVVVVVLLHGKPSPAPLAACKRACARAYLQHASALQLCLCIRPLVAILVAAALGRHPGHVPLSN